uniref:Uncharacterized protein n=1 Tax=Avena sativa TaxID=4498 RepID=A0ACD5Y3S7_AVESA
MSERRGRGRGRGWGRGRPRVEDELMYGAIDHFALMGYSEADVRSTVEQLIEVFGKEGLKFLKEDHYRVVQDALFEKQEQEDQPQLLPSMEQERQLHPLHEEEPKQKAAAIYKSPEEGEISIVEAQNEISAVQGADPMLIDRPAPAATLPRPAATGASRARRPCYGWISESESDSDYEEYLASRQREVPAPTPGGYTCSARGSN